MTASVMGNNSSRFSLSFASDFTGQDVMSRSNRSMAFNRDQKMTNGVVGSQKTTNYSSVSKNCFV